MNLPLLKRPAMALIIASALLAACGDDTNSNNNSSVNNGADMSANNNTQDMGNNQNDMNVAQPVCGNGVKEVGETCDGADCPTACPAVACVASTLVGGANTCDARCDATPIIVCQAADGCCPTGCTIANDSDVRSTWPPPSPIEPSSRIIVQPFTQTTCFNVCTISTRSCCAAITASMSL